MPTGPDLDRAIADHAAWLSEHVDIPADVSARLICEYLEWLKQFGLVGADTSVVVFAFRAFACGFMAGWIRREERERGLS